MLSRTLFDKKFPTADITFPLMRKYFAYVENAGTPVAALVPEYVGQLCFDTTNKVWYRATDNALNTDWAPAGASGLALAELQFLDGALAGTIVAEKALVPDSNRKLAFTSASTAASTSVESLLVNTTLTGIGGVGGRARYRLDTNVALGGWANALKAETVFGASGRVTGLGSALVAEMSLSAGCTEGSYAPLESEIVMPTSADTGTATAFLHGNVSGAAAATFNANGYLFELGTGVAAGTDDLFEAEAKTGIAKTHTLRVRIGGTAYFIPLHTSKACGGS
jgi:hypothetical protein